MTIAVHLGDCRTVLEAFAENSIDSAVTDPPYHLTSIVKRFGAANAAPAKEGKTGAYARAAKGFMGQTWDGGDVAFDPDTWRAIYRVLKPGAHLIAFSGTRTYHRMVCAIEDAGFEIRDQLAWLYGSGFPKSHNVSKGIDKANGVKGSFGEPKSAAHAGWIDRGKMRGDEGGEGWQRPWMDDPEQVNNAARKYIGGGEDSAAWDGWGSALKPALEPIVLARKPLSEKSIAANVLRWGVGALNIDGCRIGTEEKIVATRNVSLGSSGSGVFGAGDVPGVYEQSAAGRWPANVIHDGSNEVVSAFPDTESGNRAAGQYGGMGYHGAGEWEMPGITGDSGSAARFFFNARQDILCGLCGLPCRISEWNANTAETPSLTRATPAASTVVGVVPASPPIGSEAMRSASKRRAQSAGKGSLPTPPQTQSIAAESVSDDRQESLVSRVKSAGLPCDLCATAIAQNLAALRIGQDPASLPFPDFISEPKGRILSQSLALHVAGRENTDIITTTESLRSLLGSVFHAIAESTPQSAEPNDPAARERSKRFHYSGKAGNLDRLGSEHPTVKPVDLMRWLCRLVTPPGGTILDPFAGSGTTGIAAMAEGFNAELIDLEPKHVADIERKLALLRGEGRSRFAEQDERKAARPNASPLPLFE